MNRAHLVLQGEARKGDVVDEVPARVERREMHVFAKAAGRPLAGVGIRDVEPVAVERHAHRCRRALLEGFHPEVGPARVVLHDDEVSERPLQREEVDDAALGDHRVEAEVRRVRENSRADELEVGREEVVVGRAVAVHAADVDLPVHVRDHRVAAGRLRVGEGIEIVDRARPGHRVELGDVPPPDVVLEFSAGEVEVVPDEEPSRVDHPVARDDPGVARLHHVGRVLLVGVALQPRTPTLRLAEPRVEGHDEPISSGHVGDADEVSVQVIAGGRHLYRLHEREERLLTSRLYRLYRGWWWREGGR